MRILVVEDNETKPRRITINNRKGGELNEY